MRRPEFVDFVLQRPYDKMSSGINPTGFVYGPEISKSISWNPRILEHGPGYENGCNYSAILAERGKAINVDFERRRERKALDARETRKGDDRAGGTQGEGSKTPT